MLSAGTSLALRFWAKDQLERVCRQLGSSENWRSDPDYLRFQEAFINLADHLQNHGVFEVA